MATPMPSRTPETLAALALAAALLAGCAGTPTLPADRELPAPNPPAGDPICQELEDPTVNCLYLFYVLANEEGGHAFAATAEQHQENVDRAAALGLLG